MKKLLSYLLLLALTLGLLGCTPKTQPVDIAATTLPVYEFTQKICQGTGLTVGRIITEEVSCLHDYTLQVSQMRLIEGAKIIVTSGAGLESFLQDALNASHTQIDASAQVPLLCAEDHEHSHDHDHDHGEHDPHIWLSPANAILMARTICAELSETFPQFSTNFQENLSSLENELVALDQYGKDQLSGLSNREIITFHDGFAYLADHYGITILRAVEEESGSEASAGELIELISLIKSHNISAIFTERSGSTSAAEIISRETGIRIFTLDMGMSGNSYFDAMYHNINTIKEALG